MLSSGRSLKERYLKTGTDLIILTTKVKIMETDSAKNCGFAHPDETKST